MTHPCQFFPVGDPSGGGGGLDWSEPPKTADFPSENGKGYPIDTTSGPVTMSLPGAPTAGDQVGWKDYENNFHNAEFYADPQGKLIEGQQGPLKVTSRGAGGTLVFIDDEVGWLLVDHTPLDGGTVANKPFMHVQDRKSSGTVGGSSSVGWNDRDLNSVLSNDIPGASLGGNEVTLPAGTYYIQAYSTIVLDALQGISAVRKSDGTLLFQSGPVGKSTSFITSNSPIAGGKVVFSEATTIKLSSYHEDAYATNGLGVPMGVTGIDEVYSDLRIWKLDTEIKTITVQDPQQYLKKPLMHVQHQLPSGSDVLGNGTGYNDRELNTILTNEIAGASLVNNEVELPAGEYYVEGYSQLVAISATALIEMNNLVRDSSDNNLLVGPNSGAAGGRDNYPVSGIINLTEVTKIKLVTKGNSGVHGSYLAYQSNNGIYEIFGELKIWALSQVVQEPIVYNQPVQPITGAYVTGNIFGGELEYDDATHVNVKPVSCMSDDLTTPLYIDAVTNIAMSPAADTVYNFFIVRYDSATFGIEFDTDVNGANLPGNVTHKRWLGFVRADASGAIVRFSQSGDYWTCAAADPSDALIGTYTNTGFVDISADLAAALPYPRIKRFNLGGKSNDASDTGITVSYDGVSNQYYFSSRRNDWSPTAGTVHQFSVRYTDHLHPKSPLYLKTDTGSNADLWIYTAELKR